MNWFKKKLKSDPLTFEKHRLDAELQEIEKRIQETESAQKHVSTSPPRSPYEEMPVVRADIPNHFDHPASQPKSTSTRFQKAYELEVCPDISAQDPIRGRINLWRLWARLRRFLSQSSSISKGSSLDEGFAPSQIFDTKKAPKNSARDESNSPTPLPAGRRFPSYRLGCHSHVFKTLISK